jgi:hypothetical protein
VDIFVDIVNFLIEGIVTITDFLFQWLPDSPFKASIESIGSSFGSELLGYLNYFLPISEMAGFLALWIAGIAIYYGVSIVLRWIKAIS